MSKPVAEKTVDVGDAIKIELLEWMKSIGETAGEVTSTAKDFVVEQTPLFVQEFLTFGMWSNCIQAVLFLGMTILLLYSANRFRKSYMTAYNENIYDTTAPMSGLVFSLAGCIAFFLGFCYSGYYFLMTIIAPRLFIMHGLANFMKTL